MRRTIWLPIAPFSINNYTSRDKRHKTPAAREWEQQVFHALSAAYPQKVLKELREAYKSDTHSWAIRLTAYYQNFFTKSGVINNKTHDITNWEKPLVDLIFSPRYHEAPYPYGAPNLNCDDRFLVSLYSRKRPARNNDGNTWIRIQLALVNTYRLRHDSDEHKKPEKETYWRGNTLFFKPEVGSTEQDGQDGNDSDSK